jgi:hypothetical protein
MKAPDLFLQKKGGKSFSLDWNNRSLAKKSKEDWVKLDPTGLNLDVLVAILYITNFS